MVRPVFSPPDRPRPSAFAVGMLRKVRMMGQPISTTECRSSYLKKAAAPADGFSPHSPRSRNVAHQCLGGVGLAEEVLAAARATPLGCLVGQEPQQAQPPRRCACELHVGRLCQGNRRRICRFRASESRPSHAFIVQSSPHATSGRAALRCATLHCAAPAHPRLAQGACSVRHTAGRHAAMRPPH